MTSAKQSIQLLGRRFAPCIFCIILSGCAVGPDFVRPAPPDVSTYLSPEPPVEMTPGANLAVQRLATGESVSTQWWELFHSPPLNEVLEQAIADNRTLEIARATLAEAQQAVIQSRGGFYPQLDFSAAAQRQRASFSGQGGAGSPGGASAPPVNLYSVGATVSYAPDVFGATRRRVEQQEALAENQRYQVAAAYLTLTGNVVAQAINIASVRLQISAIEAIIADDEQNRRLVQTKFDAGKAARSDVLTAESQLANDRTQLPPLRQQLSVARHALSILTGKFPAQRSPPDFDLAEFTLPEELPVSLPSQLVRQRPDILAAEAELHASSAAIGIATAQMYPNITLSGSVGLESLSTATLFQGSSRIWSVASDLTAPIFHGGALAAQRQGAVEAFRASLATYQQTVLQAFGQVADTLRALGHDAELMAAQKHALDTSSESLALQRLSYDAGKSNLLQLIDAERTQQQARLGYARAQAQRFQDTAQLFVAMGGGWWSATNFSPGASVTPPVDATGNTSKPGEDSRTTR
jgi:NodT family efflux transporter outer membrane factor (OMF) lipoprotein